MHGPQVNNSLLNTQFTIYTEYLIFIYRFLFSKLCHLKIYRRIGNHATNVCLRISSHCSQKPSEKQGNAYYIGCQFCLPHPHLYILLSNFPLLTSELSPPLHTSTHGDNCRHQILQHSKILWRLHDTHVSFLFLNVWMIHCCLRWPVITLHPSVTH